MKTAPAPLSGCRRGPHPPDDDRTSLAAAVWIPVLAALAVAAIHRRVQLDRRGRAGGTMRAPAY